MPDNKTVTFDANQWQLVPKRITEEMNENVSCFGKADGSLGYNKQHGDDFAASWRYALAAAPTPAAQSAGQESGLPSWWPDFIQNVCELPDRTSPEDEPEAMVATAEELESCALRAIEEAAEDAARVNGGERSKPTPMFLTGWQLLEALDLIAPDRATDPDQMDEELALQMGDETCHSGAGVYAWEASEPEEGSSFLAGERTADAQQVGGDIVALLRDARSHLADPASGHDDGLLLADLIERIDAALTSPAKVGGDVEHALLMQNTEYMVKWRDEISKSDKIPTSGEQSSFMDGFESGVRAALSADGGEDKRDAERYRFMRNDAWGCDKNGRRDVHVCQFGPGVLMSSVTELAEEALDEAIDAAIAANQAKGDV
ncbi:hypothetical protein [Pandoraea sputorum]